VRTFLHFSQAFKPMQLSGFQQAFEHQNYRSGIKVGSLRSSVLASSELQTDQAKPSLSATPINAAFAPPHTSKQAASNK
jgi:hypothetical protein